MQLATSALLTGWTFYKSINELLQCLMKKLFFFFVFFVFFVFFWWFCGYNSLQEKLAHLPTTRRLVSLQLTVPSLSDLLEDLRELAGNVGGVAIEDWA